MGGQVQHVERLIQLGYFDFYGLGTDRDTAESALLAAVQADADETLPAP